MSEELPQRDEWIIRKLSAGEKLITNKLLTFAKMKIGIDEFNMDTVEVLELSGGNGSLRFSPQKPDNRKFGKIASEAIIRDVDGIEIIAALILDKDDKVFELDLWRVDLKKILSINLSSDIRHKNANS